MTAVLDPTTLAPAELLAAGVILSGYCSADMRPSSGAVWRSHSEYLKANRAADEIERSAMRWSAAAGSRTTTGRATSSAT
jgi:hypothetical protein